MSWCMLCNNTLHGSGKVTGCATLITGISLIQGGGGGLITGILNPILNPRGVGVQGRQGKLSQTD